MYPDVGGDVIALDGGGSAGIPPAGEIQVVCTLSSDMLLTDVIKESFGGRASLGAFVPLTGQVVVGRDSRARSLSRGRRCLLRLIVGVCRHLEGVAEQPISCRFG